YVVQKQKGVADAMIKASLEYAKNPLDALDAHCIFISTCDHEYRYDTDMYILHGVDRQSTSRGIRMTIATTSDVHIELRPYQRDALTAIEAAALRGVQRQVVSLPTGAGKTVIFAHLLVERQTRTLILVHRDELIHQTLDKLAMVAQGTALDIGVIKAARDEHAGDIVVASVQTLQREARLQRLAQTFELVIVDECHHA